ncbi:MAG: hypothetical protein NVSMB6_15240 [Burkholderiaceae bacterium]
MQNDDGGQARKHHYVPQCYLKGFARNRSKNARLFVVDALSRKSFVTRPANVAAERDFNRIEVDEVDPNVVEAGYADFESKLAPALVRMDEKANFEDAKDRALILEFAALLAVRNPARRENFRKFREDTTKSVMKLVTATKGRYDSHLTKATAAGFIDADSQMPYEEFKNFVDGDAYTVEVPTNEHVEQELKSLATVYDLLQRRNWVVLRAAPDSGGFITSDRPVSLRWNDPKLQQSFYGPGFGLKDTIVHFPLSKFLALRGQFDGREGIVIAPTDVVAFTNSITIEHAIRQVYAENDQFKFLGAAGNQQRGGDLLPQLIKAQSVRKKETPSAAQASTNRGG